MLSQLTLPYIFFDYLYLYIVGLRWSAPTDTNNILLIFMCLVKGFYRTVSYFLFNKLRLPLKLHISAFKTCFSYFRTSSFIRAMSVRIRPWTARKRVLIRSNPLASDKRLSKRRLLAWKRINITDSQIVTSIKRELFISKRKK